MACEWVCVCRFFQFLDPATAIYRMNWDDFVGNGNVLASIQDEWEKNIGTRKEKKHTHTHSRRAILNEFFGQFYSVGPAIKHTCLSYSAYVRCTPFTKWSVINFKSPIFIEQSISCIMGLMGLGPRAEGLTMTLIDFIVLCCVCVRRSPHMHKSHTCYCPIYLLPTTAHECLPFWHSYSRSRSP